MAMRRSASDPISQAASASVSAGECDRLGVEVAAGQRLARVGENQRIVGDAVRFRLQGRRDMAHHVEHRTHHLRLAAQTVRVLHAVVVGEMRCADAAARHQGAQRVRDLDLAAVAAQRVNARIERRVGALRRVGRQCAGDQRGLEHALDRKQRRQRFGGRELRAVEQRETFLRAEHQRRHLRERGVRRHALAAEEDLADAEHRGGHVGERGQIARRADRTLFRNQRHHTAVEHLLHEGEGFGPHARCAARQARKLQRHHQPHIREAHRRADAGRMREHDVALELAQLVRRDAHAREFSEAGIDAVDRFALRDDRRDGAGTRATAGIDAGSMLNASPRAIARHAASGTLPGVSFIGLSARAHAAD
jgi:hypothetical protein